MHEPSDGIAEEVERQLQLALAAAAIAARHAIATRQRRHDFVENRIHDVLDVPLIKMRVMLGDALNEF